MLNTPVTYEDEFEFLPQISPSETSILFPWKCLVSGLETFFETAISIPILFCPAFIVFFLMKQHRVSLIPYQ